MTSIRRVILLGFGSVGRGFAQIVQRKQAWLEATYNTRIVLVGVATRSWCSYDPQGLDLAALLDGSSRPAPQPWSPQQLINQAEADVLLEASPTDLQTAEPATGSIRAAFNRGLHVATANKGPLALHGRELRATAQQLGLGFGYEATVMAGTPALRLGWSALAGCELRDIRGILNGTTNYILTQMETGMAYAEALADAQRLGYAETDPSGDVEGHDAAAKAAILGSMLLDGNITPADVDRTGITAITSADVSAAAAAGERWKLIARIARSDNGQVSAQVRPERVPVTHPLASVSGATNAITYTTDLLGDVTLIGPGAGGLATGFGLLADVLAFAE